MLEGSSNEGVLSLPRPAGPSDDDDEYDADGLKAGMLEKVGDAFVIVFERRSRRRSHLGP